jgi:SAM-dependent methyltransferase
MSDSKDYLLGTDEAETQRLGMQHRLWAESAVSVWERAGIRVGSNVLDLGSGPGFIAADIAELVGPDGSVLGIEGSPLFVEQFDNRMSALNLPWAKVIEGDLHDLTELLGDRAGTFDVAYSRWVPCFLEDPGVVIKQAADALAPGGRLAIQDYFSYDTMRLAPRVSVFEEVIAAITEMWNQTGDLDVMGDMPRHMRKAGLEVIELEVVHRIARPSDPIWDWPTIFWPNFIPRVVEAGAITQQTADEFHKAWADASKNPDAFIMLPPVFEAIAVKPQ